MRWTIALMLAAAPAWADTIQATRQAKALLVLGGGEVGLLTEAVTFDAPAGRHEVLVALPEGHVAYYLDLTVPEGIGVVARRLMTERLPPLTKVEVPEVMAAKAEVERLTVALAAEDRRIAGIRARAEAAQRRLAYLDALAAGGRPETLTAEGVAALQALSVMIGTEAQAAREAVLAAEAEAEAAQPARNDAAEALGRAQAALDALVPGEGFDEGSVLALTVDVASAGTHEIILEHVTNAGWRPFYRAELALSDPPRVVLRRQAVIYYSTPEDWQDLPVTLSTARFDDQTGASSAWGSLVTIVEEADRKSDFASGAASDVYSEAPAEPEVIVEETASSSIEAGGTVVVYALPGRMDLRASAGEELLAELGEIAFPAEVFADAAPASDETAFLTAKLVNDSGEVLLSGEMLLSVDGTLVGQDEYFDLVAPGDETEIGFGPIHSLRLTRDVPDRMEGDSGILTTTNELDETAVLSVENLGDRAWNVRMDEGVRWSEQEDLEVEVTADPPADETDPDFRRGILRWTFPLAPGEKREFTVRQQVTWPDGYVLQ